MVFGLSRRELFGLIVGLALILNFFGRWGFFLIVGLLILFLLKKPQRRVIVRK